MNQLYNKEINDSQTYIHIYIIFLLKCIKKAY